MGSLRGITGFLGNCDRPSGSTNGTIDTPSVDDNVQDTLNLAKVSRTMKIKCIHSNCQSAINKKSEIRELVECEKPLILALTEFGAPSSMKDDEISIPDYTLYRDDHSDGNGGPGRGVALYIKNSLNHSSSPQMQHFKFDCAVWCQVKMNKSQSLLIGTIYRSPNASDSNNQILLKMMTAAGQTQCDYICICGDFNFPLIDWDTNYCLDRVDSLADKFLKCVTDLGLKQHIRIPTRFRGEQKSCLDLVFTNEDDIICEISESDPLGKSDHNCQIWNIAINEILFKNDERIRYDFGKANWQGLRQSLKEVKMDPADTANDMNDKLVDTIVKLKKKFVPQYKPKMKGSRLPWTKNSAIKKQRRYKKISWNCFRRSGHPRDYDAYKIERNKLTNLIRYRKMTYEQNLISGMKENPSRYHSHCRKSLKSKPGITNVINNEGLLTQSEQETAEALNTFYQSKFTIDDLSDLPAFPQKIPLNCILERVDISVSDVEDVLKELNSNKATGPDEIDNHILKECADTLAPLLHQLYKKSLETADVPRLWKWTEVSPIHKGGLKSLMKNLRPVGLTSNICKVLEKILVKNILAFLSRYDLLCPQQHGFVKGKSCQTNILICYERWTKMIDSGNSVDIAYFDYASAFDKVCHRLMIHKLNAYGIRGLLLEWFQAWLIGRMQRVVVGNSKSEWLEVMSGTTQGTVLGFLLFLIFINDLPDSCSPGDPDLIMLLADDTKSYQEIRNLPEHHTDDHRQLQNRIDAIGVWARTWKMELHPDKAKILHVGTKNPKAEYKLEGKVINTVEEEKDIGFWVTSDLSTETHVRKCRAKALAEIFRIKRNFSYIDKRAFCVLYNQRIRPHLDHGMAASPPGSCADSNLLEAVQDKATALVHGLKHRNAEERRKALGLMTLKQRRERGDCIEVYKMLNGLTNINPSLFWEVRRARNGFRLVKEHATNGKKARHSFFSYRVVQTWNLLPASIKNAPSLDSFKKRLDKNTMNRNATN